MKRSDTRDPARALLAECQEVLSHHAKTFRWAQWFLSEQARQDSALVYAWCRAVDDAVDEASSAVVAEEALRRWESELEEARPRGPLTEAYVRLCHRRGIGLEPARALLSGARSDLGRVRLESDAELSLYCYRVAGTVGLMMAGLLGAPVRAHRHAVDLGRAMQLTNLCRDVLEDARRGRIYLPSERLREQGLDGERLLASPQTWSAEERQRLARVVLGLLREADALYDSGREGLADLPPRAALAIAIAARLYQGIGHRLRSHHGGDPLHGRTRVPLGEKLLLTLVAVGDWGKAQGRRVRALPKPGAGRSALAVT
mgnify:CR=1 FL=1